MSHCVKIHPRWENRRVGGSSGVPPKKSLRTSCNALCTCSSVESASSRYDSSPKASSHFLRSSNMNRTSQRCSWDPMRSRPGCPRTVATASTLAMGTACRMDHAPALPENKSSVSRPTSTETVHFEALTNWSARAATVQEMRLARRLWRKSRYSSSATTAVGCMASSWMSSCQSRGGPLSTSSSSSSRSKDCITLSSAPWAVLPLAAGAASREEPFQCVSLCTLSSAVVEWRCSRPASPAPPPSSNSPLRRLAAAAADFGDMGPPLCCRYDPGLCFGDGLSLPVAAAMMGAPFPFPLPFLGSFFSLADLPGDRRPLAALAPTWSSDTTLR
mmetsp:Transcript_33239/g.96270  ORF Transcript_33239/g.96270 Transcript_33239/m.96270 type:complete len:330 (-) Transcript_33239:287-1276(-)